MTISSARRRIVEVLETCQIDARTRSLLQKALAESWEVAPIRKRETGNQTSKPSASVHVRYPSPPQERSP
jgi:hypothetical protein